jgi:SAM-dependent methyltransferase
MMRKPPGYSIYPNESVREAVSERFPGGGISIARLRTTSRILDVGCGSGSFLLRLQEAAASLLACKGIIVVRIPAVSSYAWERYGVAWMQLDAPRHFFLHSPKSMTR